MGEEGAWGYASELTQKVTLRHVCQGDLYALRIHRNEAGTRMWLRDCRQVTEEQQVNWFLGGGAAVIRVAVAGGRDVGIARVQPMGGGDFQVGGDVFSSFRGRGYGHAVFGAACQEAVRMGATSLSLFVFVKNVQAVSIYSQAGFDWDENEPAVTLIRGGRPMVYAKMSRTVDPGLMEGSVA